MGSAFYKWASSLGWKVLFSHLNVYEGPRKRSEGGECDPIKILLEILAYIPNSSRNLSLLARSRPPSYRLAIDP
jgi:hypothetical protein